MLSLLLLGMILCAKAPLVWLGGEFVKAFYEFLSLAGKFRDCGMSLSDYM